LCYLLSYYSRDTFSKRKNETKFENKNSLIKKSLYYTEKNFHFVRVFFKNLYTLFTFDFTTEKIPLYNTEKKLGFVDVF